MTPINYNTVWLPVEPVIDGSIRGCSGEIHLHVQVKDACGPDCKVGHFGHNFFFRTNAGMKMRKYTSLETLQRAVAQRLRKDGIEILRWEPREVW